MKIKKLENIMTGEPFAGTTIEPNAITVLVGRNGYGKSSFLKTLMEHLKKKKIPFVEWNDNEHGRSNGKGRMLLMQNIEALSDMAFCSEGESILGSIAHIFLPKAGQTIRNPENKEKKVFLLLDQLDSGLDAYQLDELKDILKDTVIADAIAHQKEAYILLTANSFELAENEDCLDPVTGEHHKFTTLAEYKNYIKRQYKKQ